MSAAGWLVIVMLLVGACGGDGSSDTSPPPTSSDPGETTTTVLDPATTTSTSVEPQGGDDIVIRFSVEGGFTGLSRTLEIRDDGAATVDSNGALSSGQVEPADLDQLVASLDSSGLFEEDATFEAEGADLQRYEIRFADTTVVAFDGAIPPELIDPIDTMQQIITELLTA